jgi:hypothetical protein
LIFHSAIPRVNSHYFNSIRFLLVAPLITPFSFDGPKLEGKEAQLICFASDGDLPISIHWTWQGIGTDPAKNGIEISRFGPKTSILSIDSLKHYTHTGKYTCTISNAAGSATHSTELQVLGNINLGQWFHF